MQILISSASLSSICFGAPVHESSHPLSPCIIVHVWKNSVCQFQFLLFNRIHLRSSGFCSCFTIEIQVDFRQCFRGSISITAQCTETQLMTSERLGRDLQIRNRSLYVVAPLWRNLDHKVSTSVKLFLLYSSFLLSPGHHSVLDCSIVMATIL